jgi:hypothetical protein
MTTRGVRGRADDLDIRLRGKQRDKTLPQHGMVIGDENAYRHGLAPKRLTASPGLRLAGAES